jgi:excisionase family DNA binding protein
MNKFLNSKKQAAAKLGITFDTVTNLIEAGHLKTMVVGRRHLITNAEIDRFLTSLKTA